MFAGGLILALMLISFAVWLHWNERLGWPGEDYTEADDQNYLTARLRSRRRIHTIIGGCGVLILFATLATPRRAEIWIGAWSIVSLSLIAVVFLAGLDAVRTHRHHRSKIPRLRQQLRSDEE